jgi:cytochrome c-type biogenesis protein CcmF
LLVHDRLGQLKRVSLVTAFFAFFFSYFGTFITRSGIIGSVHAFAQSAVGAYYLVFLAILMLVVLGIYHLRSDSILPEEKAKEWGFTRESFLLLGQFLLLTFAVIIFIGTVYPIVSEAITGVRFNIQAPYFNSFAPYLGLGFILTITIGNMLRYRRHRLEGGKTLVLASLLLALPSAAALHYWGEIWRSSGGLWWIQTIGSYLCAWSGWSLSLGLWHKIRTYGDGPWRYILRYLSSIGAYLAHMGLVLAIFGFLGNYRGVDHTVTLKKGEHTTLLGFTLTFQGLRTTMRDNVQLYQAPFLVQRDNVTVGTVTPARSKYPTHNDLLHEVGLWGSLWQDLYVVLADFAADEQGAVTVQIHINPTVRIVWQSAFLLVVGGLLALVGSGINRPKKTRRLRRRLRHKQGEVVTAGLLLLLAAALAFLPSKTLWASADIRTFAHEFEQLPPGQQAEVREIAKELRCPTCTGLSVLESDAPFSLQMRSAVLDQVKQGREKSEILQFFVERYGLWILREPPRHGLHLFAWIVPCLFLILGPAVLMYLRYRRRGREDSSPYRSRSRREIIQEMQHELAALRRRQLGSQGESR